MSAKFDPSEQSPFLSEDTQEHDAVSSVTKRISKELRWALPSRWCTSLAIFQLLLLMINLACLHWSVARSESYEIGSSGQPFSPAESAIKYSIQDMDFDPVSSHYFGEPSDAVDRAWGELLRSSMIRVSKDEMARMNKTSIALKDGTGYIGYLETLHMLHCVKRFYRYIHKDRYPGIAGSSDFGAEHWDHCFEILRQGIMCNAEATIITYSWGGPHGIQANRNGPRTCVDWSAYDQWSEERAINTSDKESFLQTLVSE